MADVTDLRTLVLERLATLGSKGKSLSQREAAARSGGRVSHATIGNIAAGRHPGTITDSTVEGLALALDVPRSQVLRAVHRSHVAALRPFEAPERWQRLPHDQRKVVMAVGDALLKAYEQGRTDAREEAQPPLRAVASGQRSSKAQQEARDRARQARKDQQET